MTMTTNTAAALIMALAIIAGSAIVIAAMLTSAA